MNRLAVLAEAMTLTSQKSVKGLFYGASGEGKSHIAMELADKITPDGFAWAIVDTSDNYTIVDQINNGTGPVKPWARIPFAFVEDLEEIAEAAVAGIEPFNLIRTLILDEGSKMAQQDVDRIFDQRQADKKTIEETPGWDEYRPGMIRYRKMLAKLMAVPGLNVIIVAHERGNSKNVPKIHADFPDATYKEVKGNLTFVARLSSDVTSAPIPGAEAVYARKIQVHPTGAYDAKSRLGSPLVTMPVEWFPDLVMQWLGDGNNDNSTQPGDDEDREDVIAKPASSEEVIEPEPEALTDLSEFDNFTTE